jgi:hypothetical protein
VKGFNTENTEQGGETRRKPNRQTMNANLIWFSPLFSAFSVLKVFLSDARVTPPEEYQDASTV